MPPPAEAFGSSVLGDTDYLSILTPETGTIGCTSHTWYRQGVQTPPPPPPPLRPPLLYLKVNFKVALL